MTHPTSELKLSGRSQFLSCVAGLDGEGANKDAGDYQRILLQVESELSRTFSALEEDGAGLKEPDASKGDTLSLYAARQEWMTSISDIRARWDNSFSAFKKRGDFYLRRGQGRMVCVFGKVKAGKSSLGNYVAYGTDSPTPEIKETAQPRPEFFFEDSSGLNEKMSADIMAQQRQFGVGIAETTSSIQGFSLPGFTWVDTPGVDSPNASNGDLAYQYIDACDLIVFTLHSGSPQRASDRDKIVSFLRRGKPFVLVITASDDVEEDETPEGEFIRVLAMKSDFVRKEQCRRMKAFVEDALTPEEVSRADFSVVSVSARYACVDSGTQEERWSESGMQEFFTDLMNTFQAQGASVREKTALRDVRGCLKETLDILNELEVPSKAFAGVIEERQKRLEKNLRELKAETTPVLDRLTEDLAEVFATKKQSPLYRDTLRRAFISLMAKVATDFDREIGRPPHGVPEFTLSRHSGIPDFQDLFATTKHESKLGSNIGNALGSLAGGLAGLVGGPLGGIAGGVAGSAAGGKIGSYFDDTTENKVKTGDNLQAVISNSKHQMAIWLNEAVAQLEASTRDWLNKGTASSLKTLRKETGQMISAVSGSLEHLNKDFDNGNA
ncbi:dynamin family protein [Gluconobacter cerinus]